MTGGSGECFALTCPLIKKADGGKFGKTEKGNVWLDAGRTSPYQFYQFWLNASDEDAVRWIKIFTFLTKEKIEELILNHAAAPHQRLLQKKLAEEITVLVHGNSEYDFAVQASEILFGNATTEVLQSLNETQLLQVMEGVPMHNIERIKLEVGIDAVSMLADAGIFPSRGEARKTILAGGVSINKQKVESTEVLFTTAQLLNNKYLLIQKGKKNYFLLEIL